MARAPMMAADAAAPDSAMMMDAGGGEATAEAGPRVLGTILQYPDGSFGLQAGDELEPAEAAGGMPGEAPAPAAPQTFNSAGPLLNAINDLLEGASGAEGNPREQAFNSGYGATPNGTPTR